MRKVVLRTASYLDLKLNHEGVWEPDTYRNNHRYVDASSATETKDKCKAVLPFQQGMIKF